MLKKDRSDQLTNLSFAHFLFRKERMVEITLYTGISLGLMFLFLYAYPYPVITGDSGNYVLRAREASIGAYRPYGYSVFLSMLHSISDSIEVVYYGQFIFNFLSTLIFVLTIQYLFSFKRILVYLFAVLLLIFPTALYCTVLVMSDSLFYSLSLLYIASMLWFLKNRKWWIFLVHIILLYFLLYVRYAALVYPFVTAIGILSGKFSFRKLACAVVPFFVLGLFYHNVKTRMEKQFNIEIFSGFSGWALANNAVSIIPYIDLDPADIPDREIAYVHSFVISKPDSIYHTGFINSTTFMWSKDMPAKKMMKDYRKYKPVSYPRLWLYSGELLNKYGKFLIKKYPWLYFRHFIIPNFMNLFKTFEIKEWPTFDKLNLEYFQYPVEKYTYDTPLISRLFWVRKISTSLLWILFLVALVYIIVIRRRMVGRALMFMMVFLAAYSFLCVVAHPINNFRYLIPIYPVLILTVFYALNLYELRKSQRKKDLSVV